MASEMEKVALLVVIYFDKFIVAGKLATHRHGQENGLGKVGNKEHILIF